MLQFGLSLTLLPSLAVACVIINTDATDAIEPKKAIMELQPGFSSGYRTTEMTAKTRPRVKNPHIRP